MTILEKEYSKNPGKKDLAARTTSKNVESGIHIAQEYTNFNLYKNQGLRKAASDTLYFNNRRKYQTLF